MKKTAIYAATKTAKERLARGEYKKRCAKGCACGVSPSKREFGGKPGRETPAEKP